MQGKLSDGQIDALTFIEQIFWETGAIPTNEAVAKETGLTLITINKYWEDENFRMALRGRGVTSDNKPDSKALSMQQLMAANVLTNTFDKRSVREKCKEVGVSPQQLAAWMRQPAFQEHLKKRVETLLEGVEPQAHLGLIKAIESGDMNAIKLFYEIKGIYNPRVQVDVNIEVVLKRVIEIIERNVKDPAILVTIADEIDALVGGQAIATPALPPVEVPALHI